MQKNTLVAATSAATFTTSVPLTLNDLKDYSIQVIFTGSNVVGTLTLECSDDTPTSANFVTVSGSSQAVTASAGHLYSVVGASYQYVRLAWTYTSGTGNISAISLIKENPVTGV